MGHLALAKKSLSSPWNCNENSPCHDSRYSKRLCPAFEFAESTDMFYIDAFQFRKFGITRANHQFVSYRPSSCRLTLQRKTALIDLYSAKDSVANGRKISIMLEECGMAYRLIEVDIYDKSSLSSEFCLLSPGSTVPVIVDQDGDTPVAIFESGAILIHLAERAGNLLPVQTLERAAVLQWLFWQTSQLGPALYTLDYFVNRAEGWNEGAVRSFMERGTMLLHVLEKQLSRGLYIAGNYSIADIAIFPMAVQALAKLDLEGMDCTRAWTTRVGERPAVRAAMPSAASRGN